MGYMKNAGLGGEGFLSRGCDVEEYGLICDTV
jgi:hypothetical protein